MNLGKKQQIALGIVVILGVTLGGWFVYTSTIGTPCYGTELFIDSLGRKVCVSAHPTRIVSIAPSITEILFAINVSDRVVGVTTYCNYPAEASTKSKIGGFTTPDLEKIISLDPDLILYARNDSAKIETLESTGVPVVVILENTVDDILNNILKIGNLVDAEQNATTLVNSLTTRMNAVVTKTQNIQPEKKLKCYYEAANTPTAAGALSFVDDLIKKAGGINIFGGIQKSWAIVSHENVIAGNPDVIFWAPMASPTYNGKTNIIARAGYNVITAVTNQTIYRGGDPYQRAGPRIIDALEEMAYNLENAACVIYKRCS